MLQIRHGRQTAVQSMKKVITCPVKVGHNFVTPEEMKGIMWCDKIVTNLWLDKLLDTFTGTFLGASWHFITCVYQCLPQRWLTTIRLCFGSRSYLIFSYFTICKADNAFLSNLASHRYSCCRHIIFVNGTLLEDYEYMVSERVVCICGLDQIIMPNCLLSTRFSDECPSYTCHARDRCQDTAWGGSERWGDWSCFEKGKWGGRG